LVSTWIKGEERSHAKKGECHEMIPREFRL
jgi:hypothetical protein